MGYNYKKSRPDSPFYMQQRLKESISYRRTNAENVKN
jgi:hypothetical protein